MATTRSPLLALLVAGVVLAGIVTAFSALAGPLQPPDGPIESTGPTLADLESQLAQFGPGNTNGADFAAGAFEFNFGAGMLDAELLAGPAIVHWVRITGPIGAIDLRDASGPFIGRFGTADSAQNQRIDLGLRVQGGLRAEFVADSGSFFFTVAYSPAN